MCYDTTIAQMIELAFWCALSTSVAVVMLHGSFSVMWSPNLRSTVLVLTV